MLSELINKLISLMKKKEAFRERRSGGWEELVQAHLLEVTQTQALSARIHIAQNDCLLH